MRFLLCLFVLSQASLIWSCDNKNRLIKTLLKDYNTLVEPKNCTVKMGVALICSRYESEESKLTTNVWERYAWSDPRLAWDPKDYDGISDIRLPADSVWRPDIKLYNSIKANEDRSMVNVVIFHDGSIIWIPPATYKTVCAAGNGTLSCPLKLGSWTYHAFMVDLQASESGAADIDNYNTASCPLQVVKYTGKVTRQLYQCCKEPYAALEIHLTLKSKPGRF